jgi:toxin ParE1/3/4
MGWKVIIAPSAQSDLADIVRYVARHNSDAASRVGYELIVRAENLANFPEIGRCVPEFRQPNLREVIYRSYRIMGAIKSVGQARGQSSLFPR